MSLNRSLMILCILLLLAGLPFTTTLAAPLPEGINPPLPEQSSVVKIQTISAAKESTCAIKSDGTLACWGSNDQGQTRIDQPWPDDILPPNAYTYSQVVMGYYHACGLKTDGTIACWGTTANGQTNNFPTGQTFTQIGAGETHTCGVKTDGTLSCWGAFPILAVITTPPSGTFTQVASGRDHNCAIKTDGTLACWGYGMTNTGTDPDYGQAIPPGGTFKQVSAGYQFSCGIRTDGSMECWGWGYNGGVSPQLDYTAPSGEFIQVGAAESHVCAIRADGTVLCWGNIAWGEGSDQNPPSGMTFTQLTGGSAHTCGLRTDGELICWGAGQTNTGSWPHRGQSMVPSGVDFGRSQLGAGLFHTCWLRDDGTIDCWGDDTYDQISGLPSGTFTQISSDGHFTCAIKTDGTLACWGDDTNFQVTNKPPDADFVQVSAGIGHACAVHNDGGLSCWGLNNFGQALAASGTFLHISAGGVHTCGLHSDGTIECWGAGQTNTGITPNFGQSIVPGGTFTQVSAGRLYTCGLETDGTLTCWGDNTDGAVSAPSGTFTQVSAGGQHACAIKTDGTLGCWGRNSEGQATPPSGTFRQVAAGDLHTCALRTSGSLVCWGDDSEGQSLPVTISGNTVFSGVTLSYTDDAAKTATSDVSGNYSFKVSYDWSGTVTPSLTSYTFAPAERTYTNTTTDQTSQDFTPLMIISGYAGIGDVALNYVDGTPQTVMSDSFGLYALEVPYNWSGTVTPSKTDVTFSPANRNYNNIIEDQPDEDYDVESIMVDISIGGSLQNSYQLFNNATQGQNYPGIVNGPVHALGPEGSFFFTSQVVTSGSSYNEIMGLPTCLCTTEFWFPYYDHGYPNVAGSTMRTWLAIGNPNDILTAEVDVYIGGVPKGSYTIPPGGQATPRWIGLQDGPVQIISTNGVNIFASERVFTVPDNSFNESMGYPASQFTDEYWFPWYDSVNMNSSIMVGNTSSSLTADVDIYIGTTNMGSYSIAHDDTLIQSYPGILDGPIWVKSTNGVDVVASQRVRSGPKNSYNELMGHAGDQFTDEFLFPWYDHGYPSVAGSKMRTWLAIGNPDDTLTAEVDVYIGGVLKGSYTIPPGGQATPRWIGLQDGPVQVISTNFTDIFVSERVFTVPNNVFNEMMGYPGFMLSHEYWFPWYDSVNMVNRLLIGRP